MGITLLTTTFLPLKFWVEAFVVVVHTISVLPTDVLKGDNPYNMLFKCKPDYKQFKVFGCVCYPNLCPYNQCKFTFRSACCMFLGYSIRHIGYICLTQEGKTIVSHHVVFNEKSFPYKDHTDKFFVPSGNAKVHTNFTPTVTLIHSPNTANSLSFNNPAFIPHAPSITSSLLSSNSSTILSSEPSTTPTNTTPEPSLPMIPHTTNSHPMITCAKVGTHKPKVYHASVDSIPLIPTSVKDAPLSSVWLKVMREEYNALLLNKTLTLTHLPSGSPLIGCKWIFKTKLNSDGFLQRSNARLVSKGSNQTSGVDYAETFSLVVRHTTIWLILAHVVSSRWSIHHIEFNNAFLNGDLQECVFMQQPLGFNVVAPHLVYRLNKAIYGLKQALRSWFLKLSTTLLYFCTAQVVESGQRHVDRQ